MNVPLAQAAAEAVYDERFEGKPGFCLRFVRQVVTVKFGPKEWPVPVGLDAGEAANWLLRNRPAECHQGIGTIGSVLFYVGGSHGPHGHVVIRISGNLVAENSTVHATGVHGDGRGFRPVLALGTPYVRWEVPAP